MSHPFDPAAIAKLYKQLMHAHLMHKRQPELAIDWLETAYLVNAQHPEAQETNLEQPIKAMLTLSGTLHNSTIKAFEGVLVHAIMNDKVNEGMYLDTAWHYVTEPGKERRHEFLNKAVNEVPYNRHKSRLNEKKRPVARRLAMAMLLTQNEGEVIRDTQTLVAYVMDNEQHKDIIPTLNHLRRLNGKLYANFSQRYSSRHVDAFPNRFEFEVSSDAKKALLNTIFPDPNSLMAHAALGLSHHFGEISAYASVDDDRAQNMKNARQGVMDLLHFARNDDAIPLLKHELAGTFISLCETNWMAENIEPMLVQIDSEFRDVFQHLDRIHVPWRDCLTEAFNLIGKEHDQPKNGYFEAAGFALKHTQRAPIRKLLALTAISEMPHEELIQTFKHDSKILTELYKLTQDTRLIEHLDSQDKRVAITHDLGF
jgi:hypothetical protein